MKILYMLPGTAIAGGAIVVFEHINHLLKRGHEVKLISFYNQNIEVNWYPLNIIPEPFTRITELSEWADIIVSTHYITAFFVYHLDVNAYKYYLVQHRESWFVDESSIEVQGLDKKEELQFRKDFVKDYRKYIEKSYTLPLKHITVSNWLTDFLKREYKSKPVKVRNGLNFDIFYPDPIYPVPKGKTRILIETTKQKTSWKGLKTARRALKDIKNIEIWTLSGDDAIWPVDKHWKAPSQDEIRRIYSSCDILVKPSWYEGFGLGPLQAMATGCAVITTDNLGSREYAINGTNALTVPPKDPGRIEKAVKFLIKNPKFKENLIEGGLEKAKEFKWEPQIDILEKEFLKHQYKEPKL